MKRTIILLVLLVVILFFAVVNVAGAAQAAALPHLTRQVLAAETTVQGYPCARGYEWTYPDGRLAQCAVARDTTFGELAVPAGSIIVLRPDGRPHHVFLAHDAWVAGYHAMGGSFLGPGEGSITSLYPSGQLRSLYLVANAVIQGIPCRGGQWGIFTDPINGGNYVEFYRNGNLRACKLTQNYQGHPRGQRITLSP